MWLFPFKKRATIKQLFSLTKKKERAEWRKRLDGAVDFARNAAKDGKQFLTISDSLLRCPYNMNRSQEDILKDVQDTFKGCKVFFSNVHGQTNIEVRWYT